MASLVDFFICCISYIARHIYTHALHVTQRKLKLYSCVDEEALHGITQFGPTMDIRIGTCLSNSKLMVRIYTNPIASYM